MKLKFYILFLISTPLVLSVLLSSAKSPGSKTGKYFLVEADTIPKDTLRRDSLDSINRLPYKPSKLPTFTPHDRFGDPFSNRTSKSPLVLRDPASLKLDVEIDTALNYTIYEKIGDINFRPTTSMSFIEFNNYQTKQLIRDYWKDKSVGLDGESAVSGRRLIPKLPINPALDRIFGGSYVDIQPSGFVNLDIGGRWQRSEDPSIPIRRQRTGNLNFNQQINMNVVGKIGEKLAVKAKFDNNNTFDFQNDLKVEYTGFDEDIIKKIEIGNVSMPVNNSLMSGAQNLFGVKTQLQFGKLFVTGVASRQQSTNKELIVSLCNDGFGGDNGGGNSFNASDNSGQNSTQIYSPDYADNQHFFLGHFFRDNYEKWLEKYPNVNNNSLLIDPGRVEVYELTVDNNDTRTLRNVIAFTDLAEYRVRNNIEIFQSTPNPTLFSQFRNDSTRIPTHNNSNGLFDFLTDDARPEFRDINRASGALRDLGMVDGEDFIGVQARKLSPDEYSINPKTGFLSLRRRVADQQMIAVSYQYSHGGVNYQVGEVTQDYQGRRDDEPIFLKLIKPSSVLVNNSTWDLMMKNIYDLQNGSGITDVSMQINYLDFSSGLPNPSLPAGSNTQGVNLNQLLGVDKLNQNFDFQPDGKFDDIPDITLYEGKIVFPILEPFGDNLARLFADDEEELVERFVFNEIYEDTKINASRVNEKNNFIMEVSFSGGSGRGGGTAANGQKINNVIPLPFNVDANSITVTVAGRTLRAGQDYTVSGIGTLTINDQIASSCLEVRIQFEEAALFDFQTKWFSGVRAEYLFNDNFNIGATILRLNERQGGIRRFTIGNEPLSNTKWGLDLNYSSESRFLTKMIDLLPILNTKEPSNISFSAEFAQLLPGTSNIVDGEGTSYLDDFENAITPIVLGNPLSWKIGATPNTNNSEFFNPSEANTLSFNNRKAKIAWYTVDNTVFYNSRSQFFPQSLTRDDVNNNLYERAYQPQDIFRGRDRFVVQVNEPLFDLAYFPNERGQNNYSTDINPATGFLNNPARNYGAITRANTVLTNFVQQNIEYIEFWLLDPFADVVKDGEFNERNTDSTGELIINIGDISEDVLKDDRFAFEHGLPEDGSTGNTSENVWGRVTDESYLIDNFPNNSGDSRINQDVGLDGLNSIQEAQFDSFDDFIRNANTFAAEAREKALADVSADNFKHYLSPELDQVAAGIVERYKNFNGTDGNNAILPNTGGPPLSSGNIPDKEDLNLDNTLSSTENYFEYRVPINSRALRVGDGFVVDRVDVEAEGNTASWYLFRIPISRPSSVFGNPDLQTIKYTRLYMTGWTKPVVLRMAKFQMVGSKWLRVTTPLNTPGISEIPDPSITDFNVTVVSIEENAQAPDGKSPYVLPPGIERDQDNTNTNVRRQNEQSIQICIEDLKDQDSRAVFKQVSYDLVNYGALRMFFHAEAIQGSNVEDDELTGFLRLGNSETRNYYEVEVPLKITRGPYPDRDGNEIRRLVWPEENEINIALNELFSLKSLRNRQRASTLSPFTRRSENGRYNITVLGDPKLSIVRTAVIGVRNPRSDDGQAKSICLWANELRVTDFDDTKGWAGRASLNTKLADFATLSASTNYQGIGFGGIQDNIIQRTRHETFNYNLSANVNADKLLPGKHGIKVPISVNYQNSRSIPKFDPTDPDVPLEAALQNFQNEQEEAEFRDIVEEKQTVRSINFPNIRKEKTKPDAVSHIYDIENFSFNYAFTETQRKGLVEAEYLDQVYNGGLSYNYTIGDLSFEPFKNSKKMTSPYLQMIKDININPVPNTFSFRGDLSRNFRKIRYRNIDYTPLDTAQFQKTFYFDRVYNVNWDLFKSLGIDYSARVNAIIDEEDGVLDESAKQEVWENIKGFGRTRLFEQRITANYTLPFSKFPVTDWIDANVQYTGNYQWTSGANDQIEDFGHVIQNNRNRNLASNIDMMKLYNKVKILKEINAPAKKRRSSRPLVKASADTVKAPAANKGIKRFLRLLMSVRSVNFNYAVTEGTTLAGIKNTPQFFGIDEDYASPGFDFILGGQDPEIRRRAAENGWLVRGDELDSIPVTNPFIQARTEDITFKSTVEPLKDLKIQLDASRRISDNFQEIFRYRFDDVQTDTRINGFDSYTPSRSGSYNITFNTISTAFEGTNEGSQSGAFDRFVENIGTFSGRLNDAREDGQEYDSISQDILIPAFLAAYSGKDANDASTSPLPKIPIPSWRLDFAGLSNIPAFKKIFSSINITHGYRSVYAVNNYVSNLSFGNLPLELDNSIVEYPTAELDPVSGRLLPVFVVNQVTLSEQFQPLIGIKLRTKKKMSVNLDFKKDRNLSLNLSNSQVTETKNNTLSAEFGITKEKFRIPFKIQGRTVTLDNDLTLRVSVAIRDTKTVQRKINEDPEPTSGSTNFQLRPTLNYKYNKRLDLTAYFERTINNQTVGNVPERRTSAFGFQIRFSLAE